MFWEKESESYIRLHNQLWHFLSTSSRSFFLSTFTETFSKLLPFWDVFPHLKGGCILVKHVISIPNAIKKKSKRGVNWDVIAICFTFPPKMIAINFFIHCKNTWVILSKSLIFFGVSFPISEIKWIKNTYFTRLFYNKGNEKWDQVAKVLGPDKQLRAEYMVKLIFIINNDESGLLILSPWVFGYLPCSEGTLLLPDVTKKMLYSYCPDHIGASRQQLQPTPWLLSTSP